LDAIIGFVFWTVRKPNSYQFQDMHENPTDMEAVLRDYSKDMILPALELYTHGLLTDTSMYDAFVAREEAQKGHAAE
jgi:Tetracyclin repressor-like, C-terminal domain